MNTGTVEWQKLDAVRRKGERVSMTIEGLASAVQAREKKAHTREQFNRLDNARTHYLQALEEIRLGFLAIEQFDQVE